jgi:hypothetical protein
MKRCSRFLLLYSASFPFLVSHIYDQADLR